MNCYQWRKNIVASVSASIIYNVNGAGYTESGNGTITHGTLYKAWTHRELQCEGAPINNSSDWVLRGSNLCYGRSFIVGQLSQNNTITITQTLDGQPPTTWQAGLFLETYFDGLWYPQTSLLVDAQYPDWENDPYSVAVRNVINNLTGNYLHAGIYDTQYGPPTFASPIPQGPVALPWFRDGVSGSSQNLSVSLTVKIALP